MSDGYFNYDVCQVCGGDMEGDGYTVVIHCENTDAVGYEPDAEPIYCDGDIEHE